MGWDGVVISRDPGMAVCLFVSKMRVLVCYEYEYGV